MKLIDSRRAENSLIYLKMSHVILSLASEDDGDNYFGVSSFPSIITTPMTADVSEIIFLS